MNARLALCLSLTLAPVAPAVEPTGPVRRLATGFAFTEGPAAATNGDILFTDIPNNRIHRLTLDGTVSVFRDGSNGTNGLMVAPNGDVFACEKAAVVRLSPDGKTRTVVADAYQGKRLNAPNDLVLDRSGGLYFTDPEYSAPKPLPQGVTGVYYAAADGTVTRLVDDLPNPNGITLSPDEKTLYVFPSGQAKMMRYPVTAPGKIGPGETFVTLRQPSGKTNSGADGVAVDVRGNVYVTSQLGVQVVSPAGEILGVIAVPEVPANVDFAGADMKTLVMTARKGVYVAPMPIAGHRFPGKE